MSGSQQFVYKAGDLIGGAYKVMRCLGKGGMGHVYEVEHSKLGVHYALKTFTLSKGRVELLRKRFLAEGKILARLRHPNLIRVFDLDCDEIHGTPYFVMDLVLDKDGNARTLDDLQPGDVDENKLRKWFVQLCSVLDYIHGKGIVHRDIKPSNILIDEYDGVVLTDFGVSRYVSDELKKDLSLTMRIISGKIFTSTMNIKLGTEAFMAPEVRKGNPATAASDAYSLGLVFFHLLTGVWYSEHKGACDLLDALENRWNRVLPWFLMRNPELRSVPLFSFISDLKIPNSSITPYIDHSITYPNPKSSPSTAKHECNQDGERKLRRYFITIVAIVLTILTGFCIKHIVRATEQGFHDQSLENMEVSMALHNVDNAILTAKKTATELYSNALVARALCVEVSTAIGALYPECKKEFSFPPRKLTFSERSSRFCIQNKKKSEIAQYADLRHKSFLRHTNDVCNVLHEIDKERRASVYPIRQHLEAWWQTLETYSRDLRDLVCWTSDEVDFRKCTDEMYGLWSNAENMLKNATCVSQRVAQVSSSLRAEESLWRSGTNLGEFGTISNWAVSAVALMTNTVSSNDMETSLASIADHRNSCKRIIEMAKNHAKLDLMTCRQYRAELEFELLNQKIVLEDLHQLQLEAASLRSSTSLPFWSQDASILSIPPSISHVKKGFFKNFTVLQKVIIPNSVTNIEDSAFEGCSQLEAVELPASIIKIGDAAFKGCAKLSAIALPKSITAIGTSAFSGCETLSAVVIPSSVECVGDSAFEGCHKLKVVTFETGIKHIGNNSFRDCESLLSVNIPDSVKRIGYAAFSSCYSLSSLTINAGITEIDDYAFSHCTRLTTVHFPHTIKHLGEEILSGCSSLRLIILPEGLNKKSLGFIDSEYEIRTK